jgi:hypothetical protein
LKRARKKLLIKKLHYFKEWIKSNVPFEKTGVWPVNCSKTFAALVSLSPDSPTQMLTHNFVMRKVLMTFLLLSFGSFFSFFFFSTLAFLATLAGAVTGVSFLDFGAFYKNTFSNKCKWWFKFVSISLIYNNFLA